MKLKRYQGSSNNPWKIEVKEIFTEQYAYSLILSHLNNFQYIIKVNDKLQEMNCLLPLFDEKDIDIKNIMMHDLIKFIISYYVTLNYDNYDKYA